MGERRPPVRVRKQDQFIAIILGLDFDFILLGPDTDCGAIFLTQFQVL